MAISCRKERTEDIPAIRRVNEEAFGTPLEAGLIERLRSSCPDFLSLVALEGDSVVGHILFTPVVVRGSAGHFHGMGLAPMAVLPGRQRQGFGSLMVQEGIRVLRARGCPFVVVLGHPEYYPRFGFEPASRYGIRSQWENVPDEAFLILFLDQPGSIVAGGVASFRDEFNDTG